MNFKSLLKKYRYDLIFVLILVAFLLLFHFLGDYFGFLSDRHEFENFIKKFGIWGPLLIISIIVAEVIFAPIPGFIPVIVAGFIFGPWAGSFYSFTGNVIGTFIVFFLARKFGKKVILHLSKGEELGRYAKMINRNENWLFFLAYFLPILPTDIVSMAFGLSKVRFLKFFIVTSIGFAIYVVALNFFGDKLLRILI